MPCRPDQVPIGPYPLLASSSLASSSPSSRRAAARAAMSDRTSRVDRVARMPVASPRTVTVRVIHLPPHVPPAKWSGTAPHSIPGMLSCSPASRIACPLRPTPSRGVGNTRPAMRFDRSARPWPRVMRRAMPLACPPLRALVDFRGNFPRFIVHGGLPRELFVSGNPEKLTRYFPVHRTYTFGYLFRSRGSHIMSIKNVKRIDGRR